MLKRDKASDPTIDNSTAVAVAHALRIGTLLPASLIFGEFRAEHKDYTPGARLSIAAVVVCRPSAVLFSSPYR
jgi:hypothetical protein